MKGAAARRDLLVRSLSRAEPRYAVRGRTVYRGRVYNNNGGRGNLHLFIIFRRRKLV